MDRMMLPQSYLVVTLAPAGVRVGEWCCQKLMAKWLKEAYFGVGVVCVTQGK